jgi:hypothetical protein
MMKASLTTCARRLNYIRETDGQNLGAWVEFLQRFCGGVPGDSWCADFVSVILDVAYHGHSPLPKTGACQPILNAGRAKGWEVHTPQADDLFFYVDDAGNAHHIGIVTGVSPLVGIAGNTSEDGLSSNGTGVFEHALAVNPKHITFLRLP